MSERLTDEDLREIDAMTIAFLPTTGLVKVGVLIAEYARMRLSDADRQALEWLAGSMREYVDECARLGIAFDIRHSIALAVLARLTGAK